MLRRARFRGGSQLAQHAQHGKAFIHIFTTVRLHGTGRVASICGDGTRGDQWQGGHVQLTLLSMLGLCSTPLTGTVPAQPVAPAQLANVLISARQEHAQLAW